VAAIIDDGVMSIVIGGILFIGLVTFVVSEAAVGLALLYTAFAAALAVGSSTWSG
jgi:NADH:ubiquinone oxidoreductase subunit K